MSNDALLQLIESGDWDSARAYVERATSIDERNSEGATAAQVAAYARQSELAARIAAKLAAPDFATSCTVGDCDAVERQLAADPTVVDRLSQDGFTPAALAAAFSQNRVLDLLLHSGADPDLRGQALGGVAPIHAAVFGGNLEGVELLLTAGAEVDLPQGGGFTALHAAAQNNHRAMVEVLLSAGASKSLPTDDGRVAREFATDPGVIALL